MIYSSRFNKLPDGDRVCQSFGSLVGSTKLDIRCSSRRGDGPVTTEISSGFSSWCCAACCAALGRLDLLIDVGESAGCLLSRYSWLGRPGTRRIDSQCEMWLTCACSVDVPTFVASLASLLGFEYLLSSCDGFDGSMAEFCQDLASFWFISMILTAVFRVFVGFWVVIEEF